jgi:hypothetical protein
VCGCDGATTIFKIVFRQSVKVEKRQFLVPGEKLVMRPRKATSNLDCSLDSVLISNFIRLCLAEDVESESAYRELEVRLEALNDLKPHNTIT